MSDSTKPSSDALRIDALDIDDDDIEIVEVIGFEDSGEDQTAHTDEEDPDEVVLDFDDSSADQKDDAIQTGAGDEELVPRESFIRLQADFQNYRKRVQRDQDDFETRATASLVTKLLAVLDNFDRAIMSAPAEMENPFGQGVGLIYRQFMDELTKEGLKEIEAEGQPFDPNLHEAVATEVVEPENVEKIIEVFQKGYWFKEQLLRPTLVKVGVAEEGHSSATAGGD